jgi:predicted phage terminase large subunit-like protein
MDQSWDLAFTNTKGSAYVVGQVWVATDVAFYLVAQFRRIVGFVDSLDAVRDLTAKYPHSTAKYVEGKANGPAIMDVLQREIPGLIDVQPRGDKASRLEAVSPLFRAGNVYLPDPNLPGCAWVNDYVEELTSAPACADWDQCDATSQALDQLMHGPTQKLMIYAA